MPRCPECYRILSHRRLGIHLRCCGVSSDRERTAEELEDLTHRLNDAERRIERRIEAIEAEFDRLDIRTDSGRTDDLTPQT